MYGLAGNSLHTPLHAQHVLSFRFHTPPSSQPAMLHFGADEPAPSVGAPVVTFISISAARCDFDYTKLQARAPCYQSGFPTSDWPQVATADAPRTTYCQLQPDADYYFNIRMEQASTLTVGQDSCLVLGQTVCGVLATIAGYFL